jgi:peptide/nickel transport system substrate-binding protein
MKVSAKSIIVFLSIVAFLCATFGHPGGALSAPKGKLVMVQGGDLSTLDPHKIVDIYTWAAIRYPYDCLVRRTFKGGKIQHLPMLATSWKAINDTTWIFDLRKGVKFHNGDDFTAEAVKYSVERVLNPATKARWRGNFLFIDRVEIVDPYKVKIITKVPAPLLIKNLAWGMGIVPPKYFEEKGSGYVATHPVGTGPYKFVRWVKDEEVVFEANESYWAGPPNIKTLIIKPIPEASTRVAALLGGDADVVKKIPSHLIPMVNKSGRAKVVVTPSPLSINALFNTLKEGPLQDKRVRQAINYAVDRENIIKTVLEGHGTPLYSTLSPFIFGYDPSIKPYPYDPEKAKALLKKAGYGSGLTLTYGTCSGRYDKDKEFAEAIAGQLGNVGVNVKVKVYEWGNYVAGWRAGTLGDIFTIGQAHNWDASPIYRRILHCDRRPLARWCNEEFVNILKRADGTIDQEERKKLFQRTEKLVHDEAPGLFLWSGVVTYGVSDRVQNWSPTPDEVTATYFLHDARVKD